MKKSECKIGMSVFYKADIETYGTVIKIKGFEATLEVYDSVTGDNEIHVISIDRLWEA